MTNCIALFLPYQGPNIDSYDQWPGKDKGLRKAKSSKHMSKSIVMTTAAYLADPQGGSFPIK